ncbi:MAG: glycosyltransferase, partial [Acidobacteriota bacterium]|nr:glycosyltransferase [Acidobacteriota bacterium]
TSPIAVVPNGVDLDRTFSRIRVAEMRDGVASPPPAVVFIGRIHPKKGLDLLLDAWGECRAIRAGARLLLAGYGERSHVRWLENRLAGSRDDSVEFLGPVTGEKKLEMLVGSLALVLPSLSENYGMVVAEALACGTPVITTTGTPWKVLRDEGCGWWVRPEVEELSGALKELFGMGHQERTRKGEAGRLVVEREHSLVRSAEMIERAYLWALGKGNRPPWIDTCELS